MWTSAGPCAVDGFEETRLRLRAGGRHVTVLGVDKFPRMTDYVLPTGVRIADADRVRLGAHLAEGTTVMHEGFVNYNAGTLGTSMVEGRISAGVVVGDGSDVGGGASIMGTLSGGGKQVISIGERCLLGANAGIGISLGDDCVVEAGCYVTAGTKVTVRGPDGEPTVVKAVELSGADNVLFRRNSVTGAVEAVRVEGRGHRPQRRPPCELESSPSAWSWPWWPVVGGVRDVPRRRRPAARPRGLHRVGGRHARSTSSPEQARNAALIAAIGVRRGLPARAVSIALATAFQESKLRNLDHGDRDSLGIFQQRPRRAGARRRRCSDPHYAINAFFDALAKIDGYQTMRITEAAQKVQRSGYPEAYEPHAADARALASALTGYSPGGRFSCVVQRREDHGHRRRGQPASSTKAFGRPRHRRGGRQDFTVAVAAARPASARAGRSRSTSSPTPGC